MYVYLGIFVAGLLAGSGGAWQVQNWRHGAEEAAQAREERARQETRQAAQQGAAAAIAEMKPVNTTIYQKATHEIRTNTVYADCRHSGGMLDRVNSAIIGQPEPAGGGGVPASKPAR